jgi:predicted acetyltransferase
MNFFANTGAVPLSIRGASEADLDRVVEIHGTCYPDGRTAAERRTNFLQNAFGSFEDLRVVERDGRIVGHGFGFSLATYFGGKSVPAVGIASLGVAPEARGAGVGRTMVAHLEREGRERGAVLAMLHPFRQGFYRALGYSDVTPMRRLTVDPRAIPRAWVDEARRADLRSATVDDTSRVVSLHTRAALRATGWNERPETRWKRLLARERLYFVLLEDRGYVAFEVVQSEPHARTCVDVYDFVADGNAAQRTLWGFLGMQRDQAAEIQIEVAVDDPITFALDDADGGRFGDERVEHVLGCLVGGPMIRMLDVHAALSARGYASDGHLDVMLDGESFGLEVRDGQVTAGPTRGGGALRANERTLASVAFGGLGVAGAAALGLLDGDESTTALAAAMLCQPPFTTLDRF